MGGVVEFDTGSLNPHKEQNKEGEYTMISLRYLVHIFIKRSNSQPKILLEIVNDMCATYTLSHALYPPCSNISP